MVTRTFNRYEIKAWGLSGNPPAIQCLGKCEALGTRMDKTCARQELSDSGYRAPRGTTITWEIVAKETWAMDTAKFLQQAVLIRKEVL